MNRLQSNQVSEGERGIYIVLVSILVVTLFLMIGLGIDGGRLYLTGLDEQRAADAGSLSGAYFIGSGLSDSQITTIALQTARDNVEANGVPYNAGDLASHFTVSFDNAARKIGVLVQTNLPSFIVGPIVKGSSTNLVSMDATAVRQNVAVDLVFDTTGSMGQWVKVQEDPEVWKPKYELAVNAAKNFLAHFNPGDRIGLITYSDTSGIRYSITDPFNPTAVSNVLSGIGVQPPPDHPEIPYTPVSGATNLSLGLLTALTDMQRLNAVQYPNRVIVLLTDGVPNLNTRDDFRPFEAGMPNNFNAAFPTFPAKKSHANCNGTHSGETRVVREDFVEAMTVADMIRGAGIKLVTVALGNKEESGNINDGHPWGTTDATLIDARIRENFMRWLANDREGATDNSDHGFPTACAKDYEAMKDDKQGLGLIDTPDKVDGALQTVASYLTLQIVE